MNSWIFQANPDDFDLTQYIRDRNEIIWEVRQRHFANQIALGDEVFIWRAAGKRKEEPGVIAVAGVTGKPAERPDDNSRQYWRDGDYSQPALRVALRITRKCVGAKEIIRRAWVGEDPVLKGLRILKMSNQTNYPLKAPEAKRLADLCRNTGRDWSEEECLAGLWAYKETLGTKVSTKSGGPVAVAAVTIGRAVTSVYDMLMYFRSIDPTDSRKGLGGENRLGRKVFHDYFDPEARILDGPAIDRAYRCCYGIGLTSPAAPRSEYKDFGQAPDDDPAHLQTFACKVRRGQPTFRENLIGLYDGKCAVSGWGPVAVLQAAHIAEHAATGINHTSNGLLLRADLHELFDEGLLRIHPKTLTVVIDGRLRDTPYWEYNGKPLRPRQDGSQPSSKYLADRWQRTCPPADPLT